MVFDRWLWVTSGGIFIATSTSLQCLDFFSLFDETS